MVWSNSPTNDSYGRIRLISDERIRPKMAIDYNHYMTINNYSWNMTCKVWRCAFWQKLALSGGEFGEIAENNDFWKYELAWSKPFK